MEAHIQFGDFVFNSEIGELTQVTDSGAQTVTRLAPQPSKLLKLLIESHPLLVSHEQIQVAIWPDVHVDYDGSIHFCIRQIRAALQDNAAEPKFIETIARRGYRWIAELNNIPVKGSQNPSTEKHADKAPGLSPVAKPLHHKHPDKTPNKINIRAYWAIALLGIAISGWLLYPVFTQSPASQIAEAQPRKIRIAIMPFLPDNSSNAFAQNDLAYQLLESLTTQYTNKFDVIGPIITAAFNQQEHKKLVEEYQIDCLINGKFSNTEQESRLLAEVIRGQDGAHVWVKAFYAPTPIDSIQMEIQAGVLEYFGQ